MNREMVLLFPILSLIGRRECLRLKLPQRLHITRSYPCIYLIIESESDVGWAAVRALPVSFIALDGGSSLDTAFSQGFEAPDALAKAAVTGCWA